MNFRKILYQSLLWRGIYLATGLVLNIYIARIFEASGSGWIFYLSSVFAFALLVAGFSMESAVSFYLADKKIRAERLAALAIIWTIAVGIITFVSVRFYLPGTGHNINRNVFVSISVTFATGNLLLTFFGAMLYAKKNFSVPNVIPAFINVVLIVLAIITDKIPGWLDKEVYTQLYFYSFLAAGLLLFFMFVSRYCNWRNIFAFPSGNELRLLLHYSSLSFVSNLFAFLLFRLDYFFVDRYCTAHELGNYIQVNKLAQLFFIIPGVLASAVFPMTAGGLRSEVSSRLPMLSRLSFLFFGAACLFLALAGGFLFPYIYGGSFNKMHDIFLIMMPGILGICLICPLTAFYAGKMNIGVNIKGGLFALLCMLPGDIIFIPIFKIQGAAVVCSVSYLIYSGYIILHFKREYKVALLDFILFKRSDMEFIIGGVARNRF